MDFLTEWWGEKNNITPLEVAARAATMFLIMLMLVRFAGMRSFVKGSAFDNLFIILLGAVLGTGVIGKTPFFSSLAGGIAMLVIHKLISRLTYYNKWAGRHIKGEPTVLYKDDKFLYENMRECDITEHDILEELRINCQCKDLRHYAEVYMERSGKISFIKSPVPKGEI